MVKIMINADQLMAHLAQASAAAQALQHTIVHTLQQTNPQAQHVQHGGAWLYSMAYTLQVLQRYAQNLQQQQRLNATTTALIGIAAADTLDGLVYGTAMSNGVYIRPHALGIDSATLTANAGIAALLQQGNTPACRAFVAQELCRDTGLYTLEDDGLDDTAAAVREQFVRFSRQHIVPHAQQWHLNDELLPDSLIAHMAQAGVFGISAPEEINGIPIGGLGMGKTLMCVVSEELSRGYLGAGSLATRTEIAADLLLAAGTPAQQQHYLPALLAGTLLPAAVFTEPTAGSDLAAVTTRLEGNGDGFVLNGAKTWITHAARADVLFVLARSEPNIAGAKGLSMVLLPKERGTRAQPFGQNGIAGSEIGVLGYRGMCEYEMTFSNTQVPADALLGNVRGQGFSHLMQTFETARIQTAARAVGVAQAALDCAVRYARERTQFGRALVSFERTSDKLALMAADVLRARQLTYAAAQTKDAGGRCDAEAGMAKMLAARTAWMAADNNVQIHGGTGYALEHEASRLLCDARVLSLFEGASEIQAEVIARRLRQH